MNEFLICVYIFLFLINVIHSPTNSLDVLDILLGYDTEMRMRGMGVPVEEKKKLIEKLSEIPFTRNVKSRAWYRISQYRSIDTINDYEWKDYEALIQFMPPEIFQQVNYTDEHVMETFGKFQLSPTQLSMVAESMAHKYGLKVLEDHEKVFKMGNIFCGFPIALYKELNSSILKYLLKNDFFQNLYGCTVPALRALTKELQRYTIIGPTRAWSAETTSHMGVLVAGLNAEQFRSLRENCIATIPPKVLEKIPVNILKNLRKQQIQALRRDSLIVYRRRTKDLDFLYQVSSSPSSTTFLPILVGVIECYKLIIK